LLVVSPDPSAKVRGDWYAAAFPRAAWVYQNHALLWLSAFALFAHGPVRVPEDVRGLVEAAYGRDPDSWAPSALKGNVIRAIGEAQAARAIASANLLSVAKGYGGDHPGWGEDTRTPTRLGEEMTTLRLARVEGGRLVPMYVPDDEDQDSDPLQHRAWALSEVAVRRKRIAGVPAPSDELRPLIERVKRAEWTRHDAEKELRVPRARGDEPSWLITILINERRSVVSRMFCKLDHGGGGGPLWAMRSVVHRAIV
jgi:CRISPR-associated endonuclease/helicase Cas3